MSTETHSVRAYQHLREKLISGEFQPGARLLYGPIGKEIGISATPVREAAGQLANEGLVELVPQLGAVVRKIDSTELVEIYEVRLAIEPFAASLAAARASGKQLEQLRNELSRMVELTERQRESKSEFAGKRITSQFDKADYSFHTTIIEATGNRAMIRTAGQSHVLTRVFGIRRHRHTAVSLRATCDDHLEILNAVCSKDAEQASLAAAQHIRNGLAISLQAISENDLSSSHT